MKKSYAVALIALALAVGLLARPAQLPGTASAAPASTGTSAQTGVTTSPSGGSLHTSGSATIRVQPDRASIRFGVQTFAETPRAAQSENETIVKRVLQAIRDQGIESRDISTDHFSVRPEFEYPMRGKRSLVGYWSENGLELTLRDVSKLSPVLLAALDAGATSVDNLTFTTTRLRELRDEARALAVKAALEKASGLATAAGIKAGSVKDIQETSSSFYSGYYNRGGQWVNQAQNVIQEVGPSASAAELEDGEFSLGQIVVQAQVSVTVATE